MSDEHLKIGDTGLVKQTVEEWLKTVNYEKDELYVPSAFALHFVNFIKLVNGSEGEENKTPVLHYKMLDKIADGSADMLNMVFRGAAKTTVFAEYMILYLATFGELPNFGRVDLGLYVSDSIDNGVKNLRKNIEYRWENSEFLMKYVPEAKFTDVRWEFTDITGRKLVFKGYGAKTGVRGAKELGKRPQIALLDDLVSDEDARSPTVIASIEATVYNAIEHALHPTHRKVVWNGTPFNANDPLYKAAESGAWHVNVFPVCNKFPCTKEEFQGAWDDRFTYEAVLKAYNKALAAGKVDGFYQELMLRIMSEEDRLIEDADIQWYSRKVLLQNRSNFNFYITTDFATSEETASDYSIIMVWAYNSIGHWYLVDGICKKQLMDKNVKDLFRLCSMYRPEQVGVEISGQQKGFISWLKMEMINKNIFFTFARQEGSKQDGIRPNANKMKRFNVVLPWFKSGMIHFPLEMDADQHPLLVETLEELRFASRKGFKSLKDDAIDGISQLGELTPWKPSEQAVSQQDGYGETQIYGSGFEEDTSGGYDSYII